MKYLVIFITYLILFFEPAYSDEIIDHFRIESKLGGCLDVAGGSIENHADIQIYKCHNGENQRWWIDPYHAPNTITSLKSARCLDLNSHKLKENNVAIKQYGCHYGPNQRWFLEKQEDNTVLIRSAVSGYCLDVAPDKYVQQYPCHGGNNQRWYLKDHKTIAYRSRSGDLNLLDWCFKESSLGDIHIFSIIKNEGNNIWASNENVVVTWGYDINSVSVQRKSILSPWLFLRPDSVGIFPVVISDSPLYHGLYTDHGAYTHLSGMILTHKEDTNRNNNRIKVDVADFVDKVYLKKLEHKRCKR